MESSYEVVIVGGGPAGLSAALVLGRARRRVLVCDEGRPRNARSRAVRGLLSRDGTPPAELRRIAREQLRPYRTVDLVAVRVTDASRADQGFQVTLADGGRVACRKLVLATGVVDELPPIDGFEALFGSSVFPCPYCDGWELSDQPLAAYGRGDVRGAKFAELLTRWSSDVVLCTDGPAELSDGTRARLARNGIPVREDRIARLEGTDGLLERVVFRSGEALPRRALFFNTGARQASPLPLRLGCRLDHKGAPQTGELERTSVPGLFVIGDASRDVLQVVVAAGEGAQAAVAINSELLDEDLRDGRSA